MQQPFSFALPDTSRWSLPDMSRLPSWRDAKRIGFDLETRDPDLKRLGPGCRRDPSINYVVGVAVAIEDGPDFYLPFRHEGGDNLPEEAVWSYVRDQFRSYTGAIYGSHLEYDIDWTANHVPDLFRSPLERWIDVEVRDVLINELHDRYNLDALCARHGLPGKDETDLRQAATAYRVDPKLGLWKMPSRYVDKYARTDARRVLQVARRQDVIIGDSLAQICDLETHVTPILVKMRRRGVRIDMDRVEAIENRAIQVERENLARVSHATGVRINVGEVWKSELLARALRQCGFNAPRTAKDKDSIDNDFLKGCGEVGAWLREAREWNKLRTTYCNQMRTFSIQSGAEWRIYPTTNQVKNTDDGDKGTGRGVRYGRTSCSDPSVQNQPVRSDAPTGLMVESGRLILAPDGHPGMKLGQLWRSIFAADLGARWGCSDWSQQEPRIGVHYAELLGPKICPGAKEFADEYRRNPRLDVHQALTDIANDPELPRKIIKNFVNGRLYGMGDAKLCHHCKWPTMMVRGRDGKPREVPTPESQAKIDKFNRMVPWMRGLTRAAANQAEKTGCVWTFLRRRCNFVRGPDGKIWKAHKVFNRVGQGSAADQMKATLVAADREDIPIQMIVHDEFDFSFTDIIVARRLKELQATTVKFSVPMMVDLEIGPNWGELEKDASDAA